ncbi:SigE family RNA polymerase sigma factor [Actinoalloteichus sp. AHMU CJ021]|uniref:RNA polymerase sigma factor n=1 Tax=Actinoalloteichus TaxID=65496 RepID=UPI000CA02DAB|nr:SigE family RNA polymerase sigma factor [Actinoalloteichus sp. AHMU CJ021]
MRAEDEAQFREFVQRQAAPLRRAAYLLCGDWHLADDLVQNAFVKLYQAWTRVNRRDAVHGYARTVLTRCWLDEVRRPWRRSENRVDAVPDTPDRGSDPAERGQRRWERELVRRALAEVPPRQRAALVLRYFEDLSVAETATVLRCSQGTVKSQTARGLSALRAALVRLGHGAGELVAGRTC